jgi:hypothetical protein
MSTEWRCAVTDIPVCSERELMFCGAVCKEIASGPVFATDGKKVFVARAIRLTNHHAWIIQHEDDRIEGIGCTKIIAWTELPNLVLPTSEFQARNSVAA